jgi:hypothetical protein
MLSAKQASAEMCNFFRFRAVAGAYGDLRGLPVRLRPTPVSGSSLVVLGRKAPRRIRLTDLDRLLFEPSRWFRNRWQNLPALGCVQPVRF